jgi:hypothetical protein
MVRADPPPPPSSYEKVPTREEPTKSASIIGADKKKGDAAAAVGDEGCFQLYLRGGELTGEQKSFLAGRHQDGPKMFQICLHPESVRQLSYCGTCCALSSLLAAGASSSLLLLLRVWKRNPLQYLTRKPPLTLVRLDRRKRSGVCVFWL